MLYTNNEKMVEKWGIVGNDSMVPFHYYGSFILHQNLIYGTFKKLYFFNYEPLMRTD